MGKTVGLQALDAGVLITWTRNDTDPGAPRSEHALVLVGWERLEELLEAVAPRNARSSDGQPLGRYVTVRAEVSITWWHWSGQGFEERFEPRTVSFRSHRVLVVNTPLPGQPSPEVAMDLSGDGPGERLIMVLSTDEVQDVMLSLTVLWSGHLETDGLSEDSQRTR